MFSLIYVESILTFGEVWVTKKLFCWLLSTNILAFKIVSNNFNQNLVRLSNFIDFWCNFDAILPSFEKYLPKFCTGPCFVYNSVVIVKLWRNTCMLLERKKERMFNLVKFTNQSDE